MTSRTATSRRSPAGLATAVLLGSSVRELAARLGAAQHQRAAAHVPQADELLGDAEPRAQDVPQRLQIFRGGDAAEQHDGVGRIEPADQLGGVAPQGPRVAMVFGIDGNAGDRPQTRQVDRGFGRTKTEAGDDDVNPLAPTPRRGERGGVSHLAAKVEPAHEGEDFADGRAFPRAEAMGQRRGTGLPYEVAGALAAAVRRREQKNRGGLHRSHAATALLPDTTQPVTPAPSTPPPATASFGNRSRRSRSAASLS